MHPPDPLAALPPRQRALPIARRVGRELLVCAALGIVSAPLVLPAVASLAARTPAGPLVLAAAFLLGGAALRAGVVLTSTGAARFLRAFLAGRDQSSTYTPDFSYEQALAQRGETAAAIAAYERHIAADPGNPEPLLRAAELYAGPAGDPRRAEALLRELRRIPGLSAEHDVYGSNRLIDLYAGPLGEPGRALVELRRLSERYPGTRVGEQARQAIARLKRERDAAGAATA